jgi:large subunit ribosomal protein L10
MPITKAKKVAIVESLGDKLKKDNTMVFVSFKGIPANEQVQMRKQFKGQNISYQVVKKSLLKRVLSDKGIAGELPTMMGEIAVAFSEDQLAPAREVYAFQKQYKGALSIQGGVFAGSYKDRTEMLSIATIPSREVLLSQIAFLLKSPLQRLAIAVDQVAQTKQ